MVFNSLEISSHEYAPLHVMNAEATSPASRDGLGERGMTVNLDRLSLPVFYLARDSSFPDAIVILKPSWTRDNGPFVSPDEISVMAVMPLPDGPVGRFTRRREPCFISILRKNGFDE
jgi:hypothetical protein